MPTENLVCYPHGNNAKTGGKDILSLFLIQVATRVRITLQLLGGRRWQRELARVRAVHMGWAGG